MGRLGWIRALAAAALLTGCASPGLRSDQDLLYSTPYLSADGRIVSDPRAPRQNQSAARQQTPSEPAAPLPNWFWDDQAPASGPPSIVIRLGDQKAEFYRGSRLVGMSPVSTGREGYCTPSGQFRVIQKNAHHVSNLYGDYVDKDGQVVMANVGIHNDPRPPGTAFRGAPMPYFMRVHGAVGMHAGYLPGYPASHGCIRLPPEPARLFFAHAPLGTPVKIVP